MSTTATVSPALKAAEALGPHLPLAVDLEAGPLADGTVLADLLQVDGWSSVGAGPVTLMLAGPLADALAPDPDAEEPVDTLALALADVCAALGVAVPLSTDRRPADITGLVVGGDLSVAILGSDDLALGLVLVRSTPTIDALPSIPLQAPAQPTTSPLQTPLAVPAAGGLDLLRNVEMQVTAELGRTQLTVRDLLGLRPGAVVELDKAAGSPVDLLVNGTLIARGEVVVVDEEYGVRITEIVGPELGA